MGYKDPAKQREAEARYARSAKGKARAARGHKRYYAKPEKRTKMLTDNQRWHEQNERERYPYMVREVSAALGRIKKEIAKREKQD